VPEITLPAIGIYELCVWAAAGITALFLASPQGQKETQQAARDAERALEKLRKKPDPEPDPRPEPPVGPNPIPKPTQDCPEKKKNCPVCGKPALPSQMVSEAPPYIPPQYPFPGRTPIDQETILAGPGFTRLGVRKFKNTYGAQVYRGADDQLYYPDTFHVGNGAEIEVFDSRGKNHRGTVCPNCGQIRGGPEDDKKPIL
jgi:hypothetical protein